MRIIGVTGGIGSGKSTVSRILKEMGAVVIDADRIAKEVVAKGSGALRELVAYFGSEILNEAGELDRKKLAGIVFNNPEKLKILNTITHKYVVERMVNDIEKIKQDGLQELIVLDVPIPVEHGFLDSVDEVWSVIADMDIRIRRIMERSGLTYEETVNRMKSQMSDQEYIRIADKIIQNTGSLERLRDEVKKAYLGGWQGGTIV